MPTASQPNSRIDHFFSGAEARLDRWRELSRAVQVWAAKTDAASRATVHAALKDLLPFEDFQAYPGTRLVNSMRDRIKANDTVGSARIVQRISASLMSRTYRSEASEWETEDDQSGGGERQMPTASGDPSARPYFEVLVVSPTPSQKWPAHIQNMRKLRRNLDAFIYEPVIVGNFEDAVLGAMLNTNVQSVLIYDGFPFASTHNAPVMRQFLMAYLNIKADDLAPHDYGVRLAQAIKKIRPELDIFLLSDRNAEAIAADPGSDCINRIFYDVEEPLEIHLSILQGVQDRYQTPFFDNLKKYAQKPVGTFHALPVARGKSIFKSNWIRDMGEFYGPTLFLAESSATSGGLDSLLEPTGNIKVGQELAARAFGCDHVFWVTNGTSTSNKMVEQALLQPGDIVIVDRNCHKSHHYGCVIAGAQPYYVEAFPMTEYSMYGGVPIREIKKALLELKAAGRLNKVKMVILTNCTFDGHVYNTKRVMEECLAIKPDLIFLWDEAWFGFARFSPFYRARTGMGARDELKKAFKDPAYAEAYKAQAAKFGKDLNPKDKRLLDTQLIPDPKKVKLRIYSTTSTHKSMSALRQGSQIHVGDEEFHTVIESFHESVFTHASTSPNQQIIASLDIARRQMELEGYELVMRSIQLALELRRSVNNHPLVSKYFRMLSVEEMVPSEFRPSGLKDHIADGITWMDAVKSNREDEFVLDPTRLTLMCGTAGFDGTQFKGILAAEYGIQLNKTSRNSVLFQTNINNTRSDIANLMKVLVEIAKKVDDTLANGDEMTRKNFAARVKSLVEDVPNLPNFSYFHDKFRDNPKGTTLEGHMREAFYMAYDHDGCEHVKLFSAEADKRARSGPPLISANFVIPYPPGFPIMVPGQVIKPDTIEFMRKLDVKEIHGYDKNLGLKLISPSAVGDKSGRKAAAAKARPAKKAAARKAKKARK
ncbi:decarboxylase [Betaproteobacteria bacterium GR16-43]|nr:decarboxylase [Betaproteobacteria bacterium GR16-43]